MSNDKVSEILLEEIKTNKYNGELLDFKYQMTLSIKRLCHHQLSFPKMILRKNFVGRNSFSN